MNNDIKLPRNDRLFARVPSETKEKIEFLVSRLDHSKILSTADVVIEAVEELYSRFSRQARVMRVPTCTETMNEIENGDTNSGLLMVSQSDEGIMIGDFLEFKETLFTSFNVPINDSYLSKSIIMRIIDMKPTGMIHLGNRIYFFRWETPE